MTHKFLAIIPARGGSKRIPRKNIRSFLGKPIISYSIENAIKSNCFDEIMVSTEDAEIACVAQKCGATIPFLRSQQTANDVAGIAEVVLEVLEQYKRKNIFFDYFCCILATAPLITPEQIIEGKSLLLESQADSIIPVTQFGFPIQRAFAIEKNKLSLLQPQYYLSRSQDLSPAYHDAGQFYWVNTKSFLKQKSIVMKNTLPLIIPESQCQDIDTQEDWKLAKLKYQLHN